VRWFISETNFIYYNNDLFFGPILLFLDLMSISVDFFNQFRCSLLWSLVKVWNKVSILFKEALLWVFSFEEFKNQIHWKSLGTSWLACDNQRDLIKNAGDCYEDVFSQRVIHSDTVFNIHLLNELVLLVPNYSLKVINGEEIISNPARSILWPLYSRHKLNHLISLFHATHPDHIAEI
jgi:hypothetical protein